MNIADLYKAHYRKVYGIAYNVLKNTDLAKEAAQEVFVRIMNRGSIEDVQDIEGFLYITSRNTALNYRRKPSREVSFDEAYGKYAPCKIEALEGILDLEKTINKLPRAQREAFKRISLDDSSIADVARETGVNYNTVKANHRNALDKVRKGMTTKRPQR